jgi:hypothetical protein
MSWLTLLRWGGPVLIGIIIGCFVMSKIDGIKINALTKKLETCTTERAACQDANDTNQKTIGALKAEINQSATQCTARLRIKERTLTGLQRIDALRPTGGSNNEKTDSRPAAASAPTSGGDPLLGELNSLWSTAADSQSRVSRAPGTDVTGKPHVLPGELDNSRSLLYCFDFENAVSFRKNLLILQEYAAELEMIIAPPREKED